VCFDRILSLLDDILHHSYFIVWFCFTLDNGYCPLGTGANTGPKTITKEVADQSCLTIYYLDGTFRTTWNTLFTAIT
jgi:hypothetical protein